MPTDSAQGVKNFHMGPLGVSYYWSGSGAHLSQGNDPGLAQGDVGPSWFSMLVYICRVVNFFRGMLSVGGLTLCY